MHRPAAFLLFCLFSVLTPVSAEDAPRAVDGILDLSDWDFVTQGAVEMRGEFEFHWQQHLEVQDFFTLDQDDPPVIEVPGEWNDVEIDGEPLGGHGYATYRVNVLNTFRQPLALEVPDIGTAFKLIVDGEALLEIGRPGTSITGGSP